MPAKIPSVSVNIDDRNLHLETFINDYTLHDMVYSQKHYDKLPFSASFVGADEC